MFIREIIYPKWMEDGAYAINLDEYGLIGIHWIALFVNGDNVHRKINYRSNYLQKTSK